MKLVISISVPAQHNPVIKSYLEKGNDAIFRSMNSLLKNMFDAQGVSIGLDDEKKNEITGLCDVIIHIEETATLINIIDILNVIKENLSVEYNIPINLFYFQFELNNEE